MNLVLCFLLLSIGSLFGQTATLRGVVTDQSGAVIPLAKVTVSSANGTTEAVAGKDGSYSVSVPPGQYTVEAFAPHLVLAQPAKISLRSGLQTVNLQLTVAATTQ